MIDAREVFEARLLYALEQAAVAELPPAWRSLRPKTDSNLRAAARIVEQVAERPSFSAMAERLREIARDSQENRDDRPGEEDLWLRLADTLDHLDARAPDKPDDIASLSLWTDWPPWNGLESPLTEVRQSLAVLLPTSLTPSDHLLTGAGRILLQALARRWIAKARTEERKDRAAAAGPEGKHA